MCGKYEPEPGNSAKVPATVVLNVGSDENKFVMSLVPVLVLVCLSSVYPVNIYSVICWF